MAQVTANGITIEYTIDGDPTGEPLLLVMGLGGQLTDWPQTLIDELTTRGFRVIRLDNRDSGLSSEFPDLTPPTIGKMFWSVVSRRPLPFAYSVDDMANDAAALLDSLGIDNAHVVGMSMGGMIVQSIAIHHPDKVRSMCSIMSTTGNRKVGGPKLRVMWKTARQPVPTRDNAVAQSLDTFKLISGPTFNEAEFRRVAETSVARSFRPIGTSRQLAAIMASPDRTPGLEHVTAPTVVIHGMLDPLVQPSGGVATASAVPNARLVMYPDMGHDLARTRLAEMADEIRQNADRANNDAAVEPIDA